MDGSSVDEVRSDRDAAPALPARAGDPSGVRVAICIATLRRPVLLRSLLGSLARLTFPRRAPAAVVVVVVDNDAEQTAREVVEGMRGEMPFPIVYTVEPRRGIPYARNCGVRMALLHEADYVAFIDDDEVASPTWLDELLHVQERCGADVVSGPSLPRYAPGVERWVIEGGFFTYPRYATGETIPIAATNNALVSARLFRGEAEPFDPAFGLSGMDDSHFFLRVKQAGAKLVWADEAVVEEVIPVSRARTGWILQRAFRIGNGYVFCMKSLFPAYRWFLPRVAGAFARIVYGLVLLPFALLRGRAHAVRALRTISNGFGSLVAIAGKRYQEYTVIHGR